MKNAVNQSDLSSQKEYFDYIQSISWRGKLYKKLYLYPRLNKILKGKTLDIGCGNGDFLKSRPGSVGCDINPFCVEYCSSIGLEAFHYKDYPLRLENAEFDSVFLDNVLEHIEDPTDLLNEVHRLLSQDGTFLIGVPSIAGFNSQADHKIFYNEDKLTDVLLEHSFTLKKICYTPFKSEYLKENLNAHCIYASFTKN